MMISTGGRGPATKSQSNSASRCVKLNACWSGRAYRDCVCRHIKFYDRRLDCRLEPIGPRDELGIGLTIKQARRNGELRNRLVFDGKHDVRLALTGTLF